MQSVSDYFVNERKLYSFLDLFQLATSYKLHPKLSEPALAFLKTSQKESIKDNEVIIEPLHCIHIVSVSANRQFNVCGGVMGEGATVILFHNSGGLNEQFVFVKIDDEIGGFTINCWYNPYLVLIPQDDSIKIVLYDELNKNQRYILTENQENGSYFIKHLKTQTNLCVFNGKPTYKNMDETNQNEEYFQWKFVSKPTWSWPSVFTKK